MTITENAKNLIEEVRRDFGNVLIVAASKMQSIENIELAKLGGIEVFGENKVQEFIEKYGKTKCRWHFIGHLQTNKVKYLVGKVELIQSVDSKKLLNEIQKCASKLGIIQDVLLEINVGKEESKSGVIPEEFDDLYAYANKLPNVRVCGIMSVMPKDCNEKLYLQLRQIYDKIENNNDNISFLSCGMSGDYRLALKYGANVIRIGTNIFGKRDYSKEN